MPEATSTGFREILTKAICATASKTFAVERTLTLPENHKVTKVLGCMFTRSSDVESSLVTADKQTAVKVKGGFDVNLWYVYEGGQDTGLAKETVTFDEPIPITNWISSAIGNMECTAVMSRPPECMEIAASRSNRIKVTVAFTVQVNVIGDTKVNVEVYELK